MKLYKYVTQNRIDVVRDQIIRFTPPGYLSDPFECRLAFEMATEQEQDEHIRSWRRWASIEWGILCLTKRPDNLVMWAHYAGAHRGFLLEFDSDNAFFNNKYVSHLDWTWFEEMPLEYPGFGNLRDVHYSNERPYTNNPEEIPLDSFFVKSTDWAYEEEVRMIMPLQSADQKIEEHDLHLFRFPPAALTGLVLGAGASEGMIGELSRLVKGDKLGHVALRRVKLNLRNFGMEFIPL